MPTITLTRAASSSGTNGWFAVSDEDAVKYQYNANATLGGQGIEITEIRIHGRARNASSATKQLQIGFKPALNSNRNTWSKYNNSNVIGGVFTAVDASNGSWKYNTFTLVYNADTVAEMRLFGGVSSKFLTMFFYVLLMLLIALPGAAAAIALGAMGYPEALCYAALAVLNVPMALLALFLCRNMLQCAELNEG